MSLVSESPASGPAGALARWRPPAQVSRLAHDFVPSIILAAFAVHEQLYNHSVPAVWLLAQALAWSLVARRRAPVVVLILTLTGSAVGWVAGDLLFAQTAVLVALHAVAARRPRAQALVAAACVEVTAIAVALRFAPTGSSNDAAVLLTGLVLTAVFLGTTQRAQGQYVEALRERTARLELERGQQARIAAVEERTRIAREMHDIVAHSVAVMITLSDGASATAERDPGRAADSMRQVASTGRDALAELRRVLAVLRDPDRPEVADGPDLPPQPRLVELTELIADVRRAGLDVELDLPGDLDDLPDGVQATAYRVAQEALTNVLKHADAATVVGVRISAGDDLSVVVRDDGRPAATPGPGSGNGLRGMAERAALFGGEVVAGPVQTGWQVRLTLPLDPGRVDRPGNVVRATTGTRP